MLRNILQKGHPIHEYVLHLSQGNLNKLYLIIFEKSGNSKYDKMRISLANTMFKKFPKAPLTTLTWILENGKIPTETEFEVLIKNMTKNSKVNNLSQEMDDLTMTEKVHTECEITSECETNIAPKRKQKIDSV